MTREDKKLLMALTLGDGSISKEGNCYVFSCGHCDTQHEYIKYKAMLLKRMLHKKVSIHTRKDRCSLNGKYHIIHRIKTYVKYGKFIRSKLYYEGKKRITPKILDMLTPFGMAIWYMDDGSLSKKYSKEGVYIANDMIFHTCCNKEEAQDILNWFENKFNVVGSLKKEKGFFSIRFGTRAARVLIPYFKEFVLPMFEYKIDVKS